MSVTSRLLHMRPFATQHAAVRKPGQESSAGLIVIGFVAMVVISGIYVLINGVN